MTTIHNLNVLKRWLRIAFLVTAALVGLLVLRASYGAEFSPAAEAARLQQKTEVDFDQHWLRYLLAEHGCPVAAGSSGPLAEPILASTCNRPSQILANEKSQARELAKVVFGLSEPQSPRSESRH